MSFKVIGVATFIIEEDYSKKYGYSKPIETHPVLIYTPNPEKNWEPLYYKNDEGKMNVLYEYMIDEKFTIKQAQEKFPELFL